MSYYYSANKQFWRDSSFASKSVVSCSSNFFIFSLVSILNTSVNLDKTKISKLSGGQVEIFRKKGPSAYSWQANQCFEIYFKSPYRDPDVYYSFTDEHPPSCNVSEIQIAIWVYFWLFGSDFEFISINFSLKRAEFKSSAMPNQEDMTLFSSSSPWLKVERKTWPRSSSLSATSIRPGLPETSKALTSALLKIETAPVTTSKATQC